MQLNIGMIDRLFGQFVCGAILGIFYLAIYGLWTLLKYMQ